MISSQNILGAFNFGLVSASIVGQIVDGLTHDISTACFAHARQTESSRNRS